MNILMLCDEYPPGRHGGIGTVVQLLAREYVKKGHKVVVAGFYHMGYGGENDFVDEGVKVLRYRMKLTSKFFEKQDSLVVRGMTRVLKKLGVLEWDVKISLEKYGYFLQKIISEQHIDIIEMPDYNDYMRFCNHAIDFPQFNIPTVLKLHGSITYFNEEAGVATPGHIREMELQLMNRASSVVSVSKYTAEKTAQYFHYKKRIDVLYNGISIPELTNEEKISGLVVFTGSLVAKKGIYQLMKAWNIVTKHIPDGKLYVFGKGPVNKIAKLLDHNARQTVYFKGHVGRKQLFETLATSSVAIFPSYAETFGLGVVEAMACNTAVIYSTKTTGPELIDDGRNGMLVDPDDVQAISSKLITLINNADLRERLAREGRKDVIEKFNIEVIANMHIDYYEGVINNYSHKIK